MQQTRKTYQNKKTLSYKRLLICYIQLVNLTTSQVETLFGELEYIEPRLKAMGVTGGEVGNA
jgi:hypothetical protein